MTFRTLPALAAITFLMLGTPVRSAMKTVGPNGEKPTASDQVTVSGIEAARLAPGNHTAVMLWHTSSAFITAVTAGARAEFGRLGIGVASVENAEFDAAKQGRDLEKALSEHHPDIILSLPIDPVISAVAFQKAVRRGTALVFLSNVPKGYGHGREYAALVTNDLCQMGKQAADALALAIGGAGNVGCVFYDADHYAANQRDKAFRTAIRRDYPDIRIVADQGISDIGRAEEIARAMLMTSPKMDGIYVTWSTPAEGVLEVLKTCDKNAAIRMVTVDLSEPLGIDMIQNGNVAAVVADDAYELGRAMAAAGALRLLGRHPPPFIVAPAMTIIGETICEGWTRSFHAPPPPGILKAVKDRQPKPDM